jgi:phage terminase large subunit GpA-like protein
MIAEPLALPDRLRQIEVFSSHPTAVEEARARIATAAADFLSTPRQMNVVEHSEAYVRLASGNAVPGKFRVSRREISRGPYLWVTERGVKKISLGIPIQLFKTQLLTNTILWRMNISPCHILMVQPIEKSASKWANRQFMPTLRASPELSPLIPEKSGRTSENTILEKVFPGGFLRVANAGSPDELAGLPFALVLMDEIDKMPVTKEGDPLTLAEGRMTSYFNQLSIRVCSFTVSKRTDEGPTIAGELESSDQRKPFVKCPHCGHDHVMHWRDRSGGYSLIIPTDGNGERDPDRAGYSCPSCGTIWDESDRLEALKTIRWRQTRKFSCCGVSQDPEARWIGSDQTPADFDRQWHALEGVDRAKCSECGDLAVSNEHAGGWCNRFYDPRVSLAEFAKRFLATIGNRSKLRAFVNTDLAEPFDDQVFQEIKPGDVLDRGEPWPVADETDPDLPIPVLPDQVAVITVGVDVQEGHADGKTDRRWAIETVGWGVGEESWSLDYREVPGDVLDTREWDRILYPLLLRQYRRADGRLCGNASSGGLRVQKIRPPEALLTCRGEPIAPDPSTATDAAVARWELELMAAGCDCRDKLAAIAAWARGEKPPASSCQ